MPHKISFIIASVDRDQQLQQCIASIEKAHIYSQDIPVEILVVIQKAQQKKNILINYPEITTFYYIDKIGLSAARNFAIEKSKGDYLVFLDDDAAISENFIEVLSKKIKLYDKVGAFCGKLIDSVQGIPFSCLFYNNNVKKLRRLEYQYFMGSAHILSKKVIEKIGGYNERFGVGSKYYRGGEETELFFRLKVAREQVLYLPDVVFFHPIPVTSEGYADNYGHAFSAMMAKSCTNDKAYFYIYLYIVSVKMLKAGIRLAQKWLFKGKYAARDEKYQYAAWLKGMFRGIGDFVKNGYN